VEGRNGLSKERVVEGSKIAALEAVFGQWTAVGGGVEGQSSWDIFPRGDGNYHYAIGKCCSTVLAVLYI
jgi:hypothetical protein